MKQSLLSYLYDKAGVFKFAILTSPLFVAGLVAKLYASAFFASSYFATLFVPFLKYYTLTGEDPYTHFYSLGITEAFPYPQLMLYIMSLPGQLLSPLLHPEVFAITNGDLFIYHLPILLADIVILLVLSRWLKNQHRALLIFYWLSPLLIYINYLHSQLDVIPIAFVFVFLHYLFKERWLLSAVLLAAGIACKFHLVILVPFTIIYLWRKLGLQSLVVPLFISTLAIVFITINNIQLFSFAFLEMVFNNREQLKLFDLQIPLGSAYTVYVIPLTFFILTLHSLTFRRINRDTFVMFLGFAFGILTLFIPPMPGWYYWIIPFFIYFTLKNHQFSKLPLLLLTAAYFLHFALVPTSDFFAIFTYTFPGVAALPNIYTLLLSYGLPAHLISNLAFTLLQACLLTNVVLIYRRGVEESKKTKLYNMPYLVGIAGDSGSGKTTLTKLLTDVFGKNEVATVEGDALHRWERGNEMWQHYTHLDPKANKLHEDIEHILQLREGKDTYRRHYDHHTGTFTTPERLRSKKLILFEGLHSFYLTTMANLLDLKVFIMPEEQLRIHWKLRRDMTERGHSRERVLAQLKQRERDAAEYIASQEPLSDITFTLRAETIPEEKLGSQLPLELFLEIRSDNAINADSFLSALSSVSTIRVEHRFIGRSQLIRIYGDVSAPVVERLSFLVCPEVYDITLHDPVWTEGYNGIMQLFLCFGILSKLRFVNFHE